LEMVRFSGTFSAVTLPLIFTSSTPVDMTLDTLSYEDVQSIEKIAC
jgi:hypothetical protein